MTDRLDVLGIGNAVVDVIARAQEAFIEERGLDKGMMRLIDTGEADDLYAAMGPGVEISGGSGANTMAGLASLGARAGFIGVVRDDQLGKVFRHDISSLGVSYKTAPRGAGAPTARCLILVTPDGERTMNTYLGASQGLGVSDIDETEIARADIVYLEGYLFDPPAAKEAFHAAAKAAHANGGRVALTLSDPFCVERHRDAFAAFVRDEVDILFANEKEIVALYQSDSFAEARDKARADVAIVALTRSEKGSVAAGNGEMHEVEAEPVSRVEDATGAGDLYAAGFLYALSRGRGLADCAKLGGIAAGEAISHIGARPETDLKQLAKVRGISL